MNRPSVSVFVRRERSVFIATCGMLERRATGRGLAVRAVASAALEVPEREIALIDFSDSVARATVKAKQGEPRDWSLAFASVVCLAAVGVMWFVLVKGGAL